MKFVIVSIIVLATLVVPYDDLAMGHKDLHSWIIGSCSLVSSSFRMFKYMLKASKEKGNKNKRKILMSQNMKL